MSDTNTAIVKDEQARNLLKKMPLAVEIADDDGNVIHKSIGNPTTNRIRLYSSWLGNGSGSSTGGNTGGNTGTGGDDGGDTGGTTTNPGHESIGFDTYPGDLYKGEVTKRYKLWQGPSALNSNTVVNFNQDLGTDLAVTGDGLQADISMVETPYFAGKAMTSRTISIVTNNGDNWKYLTNIPLPISIKKENLATKNSLSIPLSVKNNKIIYVSGKKSLADFTTLDKYPGTINDFEFPSTELSSSGTIVPSKVVDDGFMISLARQCTGVSLVVTKDGKNIAKGVASKVIVQGLKPLKSYVTGEFKVHFEDISGNKVSNDVDVASFSTANNYSDSDSIYDISKATFSAVKSYSTGFSLDVTLTGNYTDGSMIAVFDPDGNLVSYNNYQYNYIEVSNLKPSSKYSGYTVAIVNEHLISDTDVVSVPKANFQYKDDGTMDFKPVQGVVKDSSGNILSTYDIVLNYINSYTSQSAVDQISTQNILFEGASTTAQLRDVTKNFDNIQDGLVIKFVDEVVWTYNSSIYKFHLSDFGFLGSIKIPKKEIFSGVTNIDISGGFSDALGHMIGAKLVPQYKNGVWSKPDVTSGSFPHKIQSCDVKISTQGGSVDLSSTFNMIDLMNSEVEGTFSIQIASVSAYKEGE
ncbi:hypothetical protein [Companilactobacillus kedongensis]|uniref:hypothetical protein n=1 Tax=Companilactobacillus kedongensis TaxID=2486004 RepID=UPI000F7960B0|nr:hypothetical protein [Companilactobacillus kedongensis]